MSVPAELVPYCPRCKKPMSMNLRADDTFVEDEGWHRAAGRYQEFLHRHQKGKVLFLELAVGYNTPTIVKYSFWRMAYEWEDALYACLNYGEAFAPDEIKRSQFVSMEILERFLINSNLHKYHWRNAGSQRAFHLI